MKIMFKNTWYPIFLVTALMIGFSVRIINLLIAFDIISILHIIFILVVLFGVFFLKSKSSRILVKVWALLSIIGGILGLISIALFVVIGREENNVEFYSLIRHMLHLLFGIILIKYWNSSVEDKIIQE